MKTVLIGTTALNRSLLHKDIIPDWYNYLNALDRDHYDIHWFINIDYIEKMVESVQETSDYLKQIITNIPITIVEKEHINSSDFLKACKRLSSNIDKYVINNRLNIDDVIIIWLEDDWKLNTNNNDLIKLQDIIETYLSNKTCINLTSLIDNNYIHALAPSIINYNLWSILHLKSWNEPHNSTRKSKNGTYIDPEHCVGLYFRKHFDNYEYIQNITVIQGEQSIDTTYVETSRGVRTTVLEAEYMLSDNSYYTYEDICRNNNMNLDDKLILKTDVIEFNKDKLAFVRIVPSHCVDGCNYGREFMLHNYQLTKQKNNIVFYKDTE